MNVYLFIYLPIFYILIYAALLYCWNNFHNGVDINNTNNYNVTE